MLIKNTMLMAKKNIVKSGLVLWLEGKDFTNTPPTTTWRDRSGLGNNATPHGMAYTPSSGSDDVGGVVFDGVDDYCSQISTNIMAFGVDNFAIIANIELLNLPIPNTFYGLFNNRAFANDQVYMILRNTSENYTLEFANVVGSATQVRLVFAWNPVINVNYYITLVKRVGVYQLIINGVQVGSDITNTNSISVNSAPFYLGTYSDTLGYSNLILKQFLLYKNKTLTDSEIRQNYNASR